MVVHFPQKILSARPSSSSLLSSPVRQPASAPYVAQLQQLYIGMSMVPEVLAPPSRPTSPGAEARIETLRKKIQHDVFDRKLLVAGDYPRLLCTSLRGPFEDSGADWGKNRELPTREWSPLPADDEEACYRQSLKHQTTAPSTLPLSNASGIEDHSTTTSPSGAKGPMTRKRSSANVSNDARSVHTGMVTPPVSSGEDTDPVQRNASRPVSFTGQSHPQFVDLLQANDDDLFANDEDFAPMATSTQLPHDKVLGEPLLPSPSSPSSFRHAHSSSQPGPPRASASPSPAKRPRLSASQPNSSPPPRQISDMQPTTPSKKRFILDAVELPCTPRQRKSSGLPITPVSVPTHARTSSTAASKRAARGSSPSPAPKSRPRPYDALPEFSELVLRSAAKKRRKRASGPATPIPVAFAFTPAPAPSSAPVSDPSQPENRSGSSSNGGASFPVGFGQQDMDFVYTGKLADIAPSQALPASQGDGFSQPDLAMAPSSSQSEELHGVGAARAVQKRAHAVGRFLQSDAWEF